MVELLALVGLIVIVLVSFNFLKNIGQTLVKIQEAILDRLSTGVPVRPVGRDKMIEDLASKKAVVKRENEISQELKDEIERITS